MSRKKATARTEPAAFVDDADAYSIEEFCRRHRLSVQLFYKLKDEMPRTFNIVKRRLISREAAARWRAEREAAGLCSATEQSA
ncbi:hypothetical protein ACH79_06405 [Bradyrhizobium sp. CCBAU 051011]|nr:hypothetical protein ACH79_06405 [Bradyrhizobium sp. CCBAU 051011]